MSSLNSKDTESCRYEPCSYRHKLPSTSRVFFDRIGAVAGATILHSAVRLSWNGSSFINRIRLILHLLNNLQLGPGVRILPCCFFFMCFNLCLQVWLLECLRSKLIYRCVELLCYLFNRHPSDLSKAGEWACGCVRTHISFVMSLPSKYRRIFLAIIPVAI